MYVHLIVSTYRADTPRRKFERTPGKDTQGEALLDGTRLNEVWLHSRIPFGAWLVSLATLISCFVVR